MTNLMWIEYSFYLDEGFIRMRGTRKPRYGKTTNINRFCDKLHGRVKVLKAKWDKKRWEFTMTFRWL